MKYLNILFLILFVFSIAGAQSQKADAVKLSQLLERGKKTNSDAVIVIQDGKVLAEDQK